MKAKAKENGKTRGEVLAKIIWIVGAVVFGVLMLNRFLSIGNADENAMDCVKDGIKYLIYFAAYAAGLIGLLHRKQGRAVLIGAILYTAASAFSFLLELTAGGSLSANDLVNETLTLIVYVAFAVFMGAMTGGQTSGLCKKCLKCWYLPAGLLLAVGLVANLWTELARPDGFLWDGFFVDMAVDVILVIPIYVMSAVVKERKKRALGEKHGEDY